MAQYKGPQAAVQSVVNALNTWLPAQITAENAAWNDGVPLPQMQEILALYRSTIYQYPCTVVSSLDGVVTEDLSGPAGAGLHGMAHRIEITTLLRGNDLATMEAQSLRYLHAIQETLGQHPALDGSLGGMVMCKLLKYGRSAVYADAGKGGKPSILGLNAGWTAEVRDEETL